VALDSHGSNLFEENWNNARKKAAALLSNETTKLDKLTVVAGEASNE
jgi:hypothetical protein